jgi:hypothetical protein
MFLVAGFRITSVRGERHIMMSTVSEEALRKTVLAALLLTGSAKRAEWAINEAIEGIQCQADADNRFTEMMIQAALFLERNSPQGDRDHQSCDLPEELLTVMRLPSKLRFAFVLRLILKKPKERCAKLLSESADDFEDLFCESLTALSRLSQVAGSVTASRGT